MVYMGGCHFFENLSIAYYKKESSSIPLNVGICASIWIFSDKYGKLNSGIFIK